MTPEAIIALIGLTIVVVSLLTMVVRLVVRRIPRKRVGKKNAVNFQVRWKELQKLCGAKDTWAEALAEADKLLSEVLKKRNFKGKNTGERLVSAQRHLSDNDGVWFGHKLCRSLLEDPGMKLKEKEVKDALMGIRQALKDLGALPSSAKQQEGSGSNG